VIRLTGVFSRDFSRTERIDQGDVRWGATRYGRDAPQIRVRSNMNTAFEISATCLTDIPLQEASLNIWDTKYRLKSKSGEPIDESIHGTYERVAQALAAVEKPEIRDYWNARFLWALERGAIPAGRIISNAGAGQHKPATSTINCTVSGSI
jgi:ribonucleoside-diphosphate reductase alpha chain